jgi:protein ImuA
MNIISLDSHRAALATGTGEPTACRAGEMPWERSIAPAALHEIFAADEIEEGAAAAFALLLGWRHRPGRDRPLFWVREQASLRRHGRLYAPGLAELGIDPAQLMQAQLPDPVAVLRAGADIARTGGVGAVVIELAGRPKALDLTASRRLSLAAAQSGALVLVLRLDATPSPSACWSRWQVAAAPSRPLAAQAPGTPCFDVTLLRLRGGPAGMQYRLEWDRDAQAFHDTPLSGGMAALVAERTDPPARQLGG